MEKPVTKKVYAVRGGRDGPVALYGDWKSTQLATNGQKGGCKYRRFDRLEEAWAWLQVPPGSLAVTQKADEEVVAAKEPLSIFTDGGCTANGTNHAQGSIGVHFPHAPDQDLSFRLPGPHSTNNRAELLALLMGVMGAPAEGTPTTVYTDSRYAINAATRAEIRPEVPNADLIALLQTALLYRPLVQLHYIPGHAGHRGNERAHQLASHALMPKKG